MESPSSPRSSSKAPFRAPTPKKAVSAQNSRKHFHGGDGDDSSSTSSMTRTSTSSKPKVHKCDSCKGAEGMTDSKRLIRCQSCPRWYHQGCHPSEIKSGLSFTCHLCEKLMPNQSSSAPQSAAVSSRTSEPTKYERIVLQTCQEPGCTSKATFTPFEKDRYKGLCLGHKAAKKNADARACAALPRPPLIRKPISKVKLYPRRPDDIEALRNAGLHKRKRDEVKAQAIREAARVASKDSSKPRSAVPADSRVLAEPTKAAKLATSFAKLTARGKYVALVDKEPPHRVDPIQHDERETSETDDDDISLLITRFATGPKACDLPVHQLSNVASTKDKFSAGATSPQNDNDFNDDSAAINRSKPGGHSTSLPGRMNFSSKPAQVHPAAQVSRPSPPHQPQSRPTQTTSTTDGSNRFPNLQGIHRDISATDSRADTPTTTIHQGLLNPSQSAQDSPSRASQISKETSISSQKSFADIEKEYAAMSNATVSRNGNSDGSVSTLSMPNYGIPERHGNGHHLGPGDELDLDQFQNTSNSTQHSHRARYLSPIDHLYLHQIQKAAVFDSTELDHYLSRQAIPPSKTEMTNKELIDSQVWAPIDPRKVWPKEHSAAWLEAKKLEIKARGGRKANFGKVLTAQNRKERLQKGWDIHQNKPTPEWYEPHEDFMIAAENQFYGGKNSRSMVPRTIDGRFCMVDPDVDEDGKIISHRRCYSFPQKK